jgi:hypothetical protein
MVISVVSTHLHMGQLVAGVVRLVYETFSTYACILRCASSCDREAHSWNQTLFRIQYTLKTK